MIKWDDLLKNYAVDTLDFIKSGKDLAITQGQLYIQELIKWEIARGTMYAVISGIVFTLMVKLILSTLKKEKDSNFWDDLSVIKIVVGGLLGSFSFTLMICSTEMAAKAYIAPRVIVMEKIERMVR